MAKRAQRTLAKETKGKERKEADQSDNTKVNLEFPSAYRNV